MAKAPSPKHVFMSYSRTDKAVMEHISEFLRKQGIKVWLDHENLKPGTPIWEAELEKAIKGAAAVVVICSPDSKNSEWVRREITVAERYGKRIFPVLVRGDEDSSITIRLSTQQYVDIRENEDIGLSSLAAALSSYLEDPKASQRAERALEKARQEKEKREEQERKSAEKQARKDAAEPARKPNLLTCGIVVIAVACLIFSGTYLYQNVFAPDKPAPTEPVSIAIPTDTITFDEPTPTKLVQLVSTSTHKPQATATGIPEETLVPGTTATNTREGLGIGSTMVSEIDGMTLLYVPAGEFTMGINAKDALAGCLKDQNIAECPELKSYKDEEPQHTVYLDAFWIDQTEVTNAMYAQCVKARDCDDAGWQESENFGKPEYDDHPFQIDWGNANAYCKWAGRRLPNEAEWEKAASWNEITQSKYVYPWGNEFDGTKLNFCDKYCDLNWADKNVYDGYDQTSPVGNYPSSASPYGALDMAGNVAEWTSSLKADYPYDYVAAAVVSEDEIGFWTNIAVRGGSFNDSQTWVSTTAHTWDAKWNIQAQGFRCAFSSSE